MLLIVDNYDSFVYNVIHWIEYDASKIWVERNDRLRLEDVERRGVRAIILSPGPMGPAESGVSNDIIRTYGPTIPILGICLGHQCIGHVFGCRVTRHGDPTHGKKSLISLQPSPLYEHLGTKTYAGRYHSLHISRESFAHDQLAVNATLDDGTIMGVEHRKYPIYGVQFHPESVLTGDAGKTLLRNFVSGIARLTP